MEIFNDKEPQQMLNVLETLMQASQALDEMPHPIIVAHEFVRETNECITGSTYTGATTNSADTSNLDIQPHFDPETIAAAAKKLHGLLGVALEDY
jgi:hypothetical protein